MQQVNAVLFCLILIFIHTALFADEEQLSFSTRLKHRGISDQKNFYTKANMIKMLAGLGITGIIATSSFDEDFQKKVQDDYVNNDTEKLSKISKHFGEGRLTIPLYLCLAGMGELSKDKNLYTPFSAWGQRSLRAVIIGAPPLLILQRTIGGARPRDNSKKSYWNSFNHSSGIGGHSFIGAIPFLTAGEMSDNIFLKSFFYLGSAVPGYSRIHDNAHYLSQALMGWWLSWLCVKSITNPDKKKPVTISPFFINDGGGFSVTMKW